MPEDKEDKQRTGRKKKSAPARESVSPDYKISRVFLKNGVSYPVGTSLSEIKSLSADDVRTMTKCGAVVVPQIK